MNDINWINVAGAPIAGALVGFGVWYFQNRIDALRRARERLHDDRRKVYTDVIDPIVRMWAGVNNPQEQQRALKHITSVDYKRTAFQLCLIGADDVVHAFNEFMQYIFAAGEQGDPRELITRWGEVLLEIRRDVGSPDTKLAPADMLRSQINDIDKILGK